VNILGFRLSCSRSQHEPITKHDLEKLAYNIDMKISELKNTVLELKAQVTKIATEQQARYDTLVAKYDALVESLKDQELDEETTAAVADFKTALQAFDDVIPDVAG
jgi:hypothetical protein